MDQPNSSPTRSQRKRCERFLRDYLNLCRKHQCSIEPEISYHKGIHRHNKVYYWNCYPGAVDICVRETDDELRPHLPSEEDTDA